uniref:Uncharacterized protein n=1 Tax=viral metagenome TaxID=1070528 RepID=A0A6M3L2X1_9ZZZZ
MTKLKPITVEWEDHYTQGGWRHIDDINTKPALCKSVGLLVKETPKTIVISSSLFGDDIYTEPLVILKSCIKKRKFIKGIFK